ncbi:PepSY domain-containing protein, partial [Acinetobacter baumannii]|nr:PepSY domain-containing protein [Acinetobacter baumannii]
MQRIAPDASTWTLALPTERRATVGASWRLPGQENSGRAGLKRAELDATTGEQIAPRDTRGGEFLYRLHFDLYYMSAIWGRWIVG